MISKKLGISDEKNRSNHLSRTVNGFLFLNMCNAEGQFTKSSSEK